MGASKRQLVVAADGERPATRKVILGVGDSVEALDLETRTRLSVKVSELSAYRHTVHLDGRFCRILNIVDVAG